MSTTLRPSQIVIGRGVLQSLLAKKKHLSDEQLAMAVDKVAPVIRRGKDLFYVDLAKINLRKSGFAWDTGVISGPLHLQQHSTIHTVHPLVSAGSFKATVADVLEMLPDDLPDAVVAFEVIEPDSFKDLTLQSIAAEQGYYVAQTVLYTLP